MRTFHAGFLPGLFFVSPKRLLTFNGLDGIMSQKIELFIATAEITSDPTLFFFFLLIGL
jgi:hypothetical protein